VVEIANILHIEIVHS